MAQRRSVEAAFGYISALSPGTQANCWALAETAGHEGWHRMQALLGSYRWDWEDLRGELPALAAAWLPCDPDDLIGPGIAIDETAQLKNGDATACVAPQHAGCTGQVENCVTTVFSAYVTTSGQAWADFDVYMPDRWAKDPERRRAAGIPEDLAFDTKPQLAIDQLRRLAAAGLPAGGPPSTRCTAAAASSAGPASKPAWRTWASSRATSSHHPGRDGDPRGPGGRGRGVRAALVRHRDQGTPVSDWALIATASPRHFLLIRRLLSRPGQLTFYLCSRRRRQARRP